MTDNFFICAMCGYKGERRPEIEALDELDDYFPGADPADCDVVCDECWDLIKPLKGAE